MPERVTLDNKLHHLENEILIMDSMVETATHEAIEALRKRDVSLAEVIYNNDRLINQRRFNLENDIIVTIATTQPVMATDLRLVASILEVVGELERMGDYAKGIARIAIRLAPQEPIKPILDLPRMADKTIGMLHRAVGAFIDRDIETAKLIPEEDDEVDALYNQIYRELITIMMADPATIDRANLLMWVAHNLERMADRVTNICERTLYVVTGEHMELSASDDEFQES